jgi:integrase
MKTTFSLLFYLKRPKNYENGPMPIYLRITVNGKRAETTSGRECLPANWNGKLGRFRGTKEEIKSFNAYLDNLQSQVYEAHKTLTEAGVLITANLLKNKLLGKTEKSRTLIAVFKDHNKKVAALVGNEYAAGTLTRYETSLRHTQSFMEWKYQVADINVKAVDHDFISNYEFYMRSEKKCANNSAVKYIKNFKKIIRICLASGWLEKDPFVNYKAKVKQVDRIFLNAEQIKQITEKTFDTDRLNQVRDIFLFCCYTGLAYADVQKLKPSEIIKGADGEMWIVTKRLKTDTPTKVPLLPAALTILEKYSNDPVCNIKGKALPVSTNQKMNAYLKEIAGVCGINKDLTFHTARHTFATTVTWFNGGQINIEPYTVMKTIDNNIAKLGKVDSKFFLINISPSQKEIAF